MLAFIDNPVGIIVLLVVVLVVFGPQKLPEIGQQLGKALRELRRTTQDFTDAIKLDDHYDSGYDTSRYDSYRSSYEQAQSAPTGSDPSQPRIEPPRPDDSMAPRGDYAAAALS
ncbi:MAG TPA: twin-arginine translocase TatA/TatE family subunit, partial [Chthonomonadales bacterium]|nr:twin-arginine translocase TatA/TatE family subunit [Chthonomonadales bacterium]